jgi:hypothetical protein
VSAAAANRRRLALARAGRELDPPPSIDGREATYLAELAGARIRSHHKGAGDVPEYRRGWKSASRPQL